MEMNEVDENHELMVPENRRAGKQARERWESSQEASLRIAEVY
jgi:hypothetical protein